MARIWDYTRGRRAMTLKIGTVTRLLFTSDGSRLLAAPPSGPIEQHALDIEDLFPLAAERIDRSPTQEELDRFVIQRPARLHLESRWKSTSPR